MISTQDLSYQVGDKTLLDTLTIAIETQTIHGIIGPNGAGKSTLLKHMMRILEPQKETVFLEDKDATDYSARAYAKKCSYVFQENMRDLDFTVREIVEMGRYPYLKLFGQLSQSEEDLIDDIMSDLGLTALQHRMIKTLSGGEAQKVFIARALAQQTPVLLLDEPTSMLDIHNSIRLLEMLRHIKQKYQLTIVMVIHDLNLALQCCDRVTLLDKGKVVLEGAAQEVLTSNQLKQIYEHKIQTVTHNGTCYIVPVIQTVDV